MLCGEQQHRASSTTDVENPLVALQIQAVQQFRPNAEFSSLGREEKDRSREYEQKSDDQAEDRERSPAQRFANEGCDESEQTSGSESNWHIGRIKSIVSAPGRRHASLHRRPSGSTRDISLEAA